ncbi:AMP-binding protein [Persicobacter diffluens]|uniref:ATP-dependent acyl-CoA ligase n=1 Tax=Persicobacter diffluens TaxID=981 RepID=A0AAN4W466_9BACT|nr:ATP-dependent acyl-CoA ligase [Persicobacter diffluens]
MEQIQLQRNAWAQFGGMSVTSILDRWVEIQADKTFLIWQPFEGPGRSWTYGQLAQAAQQFAFGLNQRQVKSGDFVLIHMDNCPEFIIAWLACAYIGAIPVTINTRSVAQNVTYFAEVMQPVMAITSELYAPMIHRACSASLPLVITGNVSEKLPKDRLITLFDAIYQQGTLPKIPDIPERDFAVQFTSGTTSRPKPIMWTNGNALWSGKSMSTNMRLRREDRTLLFLPLFHANAQITLLSSLWSGGSVVLQPKFSTSRFWNTVVQHQATWVSAIPFVYKALKDQAVPAQHPLRFMMGLERSPEIEKAFGIQTMALWAMTETLSACIVTDADQPGPAGTIGRPSPFYQVEIRREDGSLAGPGEEGRLYIRGERGLTLFKEYYKHPEITAAAFDASGALDTGDVVRMDEQGWLFYVTRAKDMLRVGGENVAALEIENSINSTGLVQEYAVVGQAHSMLGEVPVAFISLNEKGKALEEEAVKARITQACQQQLADFKVPKAIHIIEHFPHSTLDRIAKNKLREQLPEMVAEQPKKISNK